MAECTTVVSGTGPGQILEHAEVVLRGGTRLGSLRRYGDRVEAKTGWTLLSWGQHISVEALPLQAGLTFIRVRTQPLASFQLIDWGEGKRLARDVLDALTVGLATSADGYRPGDAPDSPPR